MWPFNCVLGALDVSLSFFHRCFFLFPPKSLCCITLTMMEEIMAVQIVLQPENSSGPVVNPGFRAVILAKIAKEKWICYNGIVFFAGREKNC